MKASGRSEADLIGRPIRDALPEINSQVFIDLLDRVYATGRPFAGTEMLARLNRRGDGTLDDCYFNFVYQAWRDPAGQIQGVFVHAVDVTEQVLARQRLEESERALRTLVAKERQARSTAELLNRVGPTLLSQLDLKALVQSVTDIAAQLTGAEAAAFFRPREAADTGSIFPYTSSGSIEPASLSRFWDLQSAAGAATRPFRCGDIVQQLSRSQETAGAEVRSLLGCSVVSRSGELLGALVFGHSEPDRFNQSHEEILAGIAAQAAIAMDNARLFEQSQWVQNELKRSNEELRRANRDLEVFAYSASHDLQEPLRTIAISAELIDAAWGRHLSGDDAMFLDNILTSSRRMAALIQDLLAYTRATKTQEGPAPATDTSRVLARVLETLKTSIEETGAVVTSASLPPVAMHETPLVQLFQNLISNAIKYRGAETPRIHIGAEQRDGWCIFSVTDNGIGIDPQFREQVFGLFKRLHGREEYPGSGVGLAICQRLVEQYGGRIWIENSECGSGSTFCFAVPPSPSPVT